MSSYVTDLVESIPYPLRSPFAEYALEHVRIAHALLDNGRLLDPRSLLEAFVMGEASLPAALWHGDLLPVKHIALYIGDYGFDKSIGDYIRMLQKDRIQAGIHSISFGPSYIAPRRHDTQGWWISLRMVDGAAIELFTCLAHGPWTGMDWKYRAGMMSHWAIGVSRLESVAEIMNDLCRLPGIERLAYRQADALGHTYGHLLNRNRLTHTYQVMELLYAEDPASRPLSPGNRFFDGLEMPGMNKGGDATA